MLVRSDDDDRLPHLLGLDRGDDAGGGAAVDDDIIGLGRGEAERAKAKEGEAEEHGAKEV
jgi:hypothetical protein